MVFLKYGTLMDKIKAKVRGSIDMDRPVKDGLTVGNNFHVQEGVIIDPGHCWLIEIGDNVTLAPRVHVLAHDASTKNLIGYTKIAKVKIGNNVFIGAGSIVLPGIKIIDNTIIGAGTVVSKSIMDPGVYCGNPAKKICSIEEYKTKQLERLKELPVFSTDYIIGQVTKTRKNEMKESLGRGGFVI